MREVCQVQQQQVQQGQVQPGQVQQGQVQQAQVQQLQDQQVQVQKEQGGDVVEQGPVAVRPVCQPVCRLETRQECQSAPREECAKVQREVCEGHVQENGKDDNCQKVCKKLYLCNICS